MKKSWVEWKTYAFKGSIWKEPPGLVDQDICPFTFLVYDPGEVPVIICPGCARLSAEALETAEGRVLDDDYTHQVHGQ